MVFNQQTFDEFVLNRDVIGFFDEPIRLKSGRMSNWYANWRTVTEDVFNTEALAEYVVDFIQSLDLQPDTIYGVPEGATKLALEVQKRWAKMQPGYGPGSHALAMGRGNPKEHGAPKDRYFVGQPRGKTLILEDVTTTGGSLIKTIDQLTEADVTIIGAIGLFNRMELGDNRKSVEQAIKEKGHPYHHMSNATTILPQAYAKKQPGEEIGRYIEQEFKENGIQPVNLI